MMRSMTGFAHRDIASEGITGIMELKSFNNRYLDLYISLPPQFSRFEPRVRSFLAERIHRGKVELSLRLRRFERPVTVHADLAAAQALAATLRTVARAAGLDEAPTLSSIVAFDGVLSLEKEMDEDALWVFLERELAACFAEFDRARCTEGCATVLDLEKEMARIDTGLASIVNTIPEIEKNLRTQFQTRLAEFLPQIHDENRILAETAILLVKYGINEEISRLGSHIDAFRHSLAHEDRSAKKLDFLCQEMNREINTIGSKNVLIAVAHAVIDMKDALENLREQLRNLE